MWLVKVICFGVFLFGGCFGGLEFGEGFGVILLGRVFYCGWILGGVLLGGGLGGLKGVVVLLYSEEGGFVGGGFFMLGCICVIFWVYGLLVVFGYDCMDWGV